MEEKWIDIQGYNGIYEVSNLGRVRSNARKEKYEVNGTIVVRHRKEKILASCIDNMGYALVVLCLNNKAKSIKVHRLVATYFVKNPDNKNVVNHIDGNKTNNISTNLEWCTTKENTIHAVKNNLIKHYTRKIKCVEDDKIFNSINEASEFYNTQRQNINAVLNKRQKTTVRKTFIYIDN